MRARSESFENQRFQPPPKYTSVTYQTAGKQVSDDDMSKYFQTPCEERYPPVNASMIFDQKPQPPKDINYLLDGSKDELLALERKDVVHEADDMIAPETVANLKQDFILDEPTVHKIDNEQEKKEPFKASLVFTPAADDNRNSREMDRIDLHVVAQPKEKSYSVKEELHMEPINESQHVPTQRASISIEEWDEAAEASADLSLKYLAEADNVPIPNIVPDPEEKCPENTPIPLLETPSKKKFKVTVKRAKDGLPSISMVSRANRKNAKKTFVSEIKVISNASKTSFKDYLRQSVAKPNPRAKAEKNKQFDFFFARTCFRYMNEFFKVKFSTFVVDNIETPMPNLNNISKVEMEKMLVYFLEDQFQIDISQLSDGDREQLIVRLIAFLFSHRHEKKDLFITETRAAGLQLDFNIVRDVMYKYSKKS